GNGRLLTLELRRLLALGLLSATFAGAVLAVIWLLAGSAALLPEFCGYYALLSVFWLAIVRLDVLHRRILAAPVTAAGIALICALSRGTAFGMVTDQWIGLAAVDLALLGIGEAGLLIIRRGDRATGATVPLLPKRVLFTRTWPIFAFGLLYYL